MPYVAAFNQPQQPVVTAWLDCSQASQQNPEIHTRTRPSSDVPTCTTAPTGPIGPTGTTPYTHHKAPVLLLELPAYGQRLPPVSPCATSPLAAT